MAAGGRQLAFNILGPLEVLAGGVPLPLGAPKQRALLALLLIHAGEVLSVDRLLEELWGDEAPKRAQTSLHVYVSQLRKLLEPDRGKGEAASLLVSRAPGYVLVPPPGQLDAERFEALAARGRDALASGDHPAARAALHEALGLWRGAALADFQYEAFAQSAIARLEELRLSCLEDRIDADLASGQHGGVVAELEALIRDHPLRERLRGQLMLALYRSGRQAEALEAFANARETLVEELGIDPSPALQELNRAILNQETALDAPAPQPAGPALAEPAASAPEPVAPARTRKVVTVLRASLADPAGAGELDPEVLARMLERHGDAAAAAIERHSGSVERAGDGSVLGVFGVPYVHEDDALRGVRAAVELRDGVPSARAALHTAEVVTGGGHAAIAGEAPGTAALLEAEAGPGEILLTDATHRLLGLCVRAEAAAPVAVRGRAEPLRAWRLVELLEGVSLVERHADSSFVGRDEELGQLRHAFARAVREETAVLFTLLGTAGVGKSRLTRELVDALGAEATVLVGRCVPYGEGITFLPLRELVTQAAGAETTAAVAALLGDAADREDVARRVAGLVGFEEGDASPDEAFEAVRRLVEELARERPLVLVVEDIHWAEPTLLELLDHLADWTRGVPVLLLCLARPELLDARPTWGGGKHNAVSLLLQPLGDDAADALIDALAGAASLDASTRAQVADAAEGNPLFIEQMLALLAEAGPPGGGVAVPPTIQAILAARLDRLGPAERAVIERAALAGREFSADAVGELSPEALRPTVGAHLMSLVRKELVRGSGARAFRFRHSLIRDAAYGAMPKELRAELHVRFADWLEGAEGAAPELVGHHLEQSHGYRVELGLDGTATAELAERAADVLGRAGHGAFARGDLAAAANLLERTVALSNGRRLEPLIGLAEALQGLGRLERADAVLAEASVAAEAAGDRRALANIELDRLDLRGLVDPSFGADELRAGAEAALAIFEELGDELGMARAWRAVAEVHLTRCRWGECAEALERALAHAERAGGDAEAAACRTMLASALYYGATPVGEARRRCEAILSEGAGHPGVEANVLCYLGGLAALEGRFDDARELLLRGRGIFEELGHTVGVAGTTTVSGPVELLAGEPAAAERELRAGYEAFEAMGETGVLSTLAALLAEALLLQGCEAEAEELTRESEAAAAADDAASQVAWRTVRALVLSRRGETDQAARLGEEAVALAAETDFPALHGKALAALAEVRRASGDDAGAQRLDAEAALLYERKGIRVQPFAEL